MAILSNSWFYRGYQISIWQDPNRYRAMIWAKNPRTGLYSVKKRRMHDKDRDRLESRAMAWADERPLIDDDPVLARRKEDLARWLTDREDILEVSYEPHLASMQNLSPDKIVVGVKAWSEKYRQSFWVEQAFSIEFFLDEAICLPDFVLSLIELAEKEGPLTD